jgi:hypothetical protein
MEHLKLSMLALATGLLAACGTAPTGNAAPSPGVTSAGIDTSAGVADETVLTPSGKMRRACVHAVTDDVHPVDESAAVASCAVAAPSAVSPATDAEPAGWVAWADEDLATGVSFLQADFEVPPVPGDLEDAAANDQVLFIFPSLTPAINPPILQPVLQFGESADGGGAYWSIASWYLSEDANYWVSKVYRVNPGDRLRGTMKGTAPCSAGVCASWTVTLADLTQPALTTTLVTPAGRHHFVQIQGGALETYQIESCAQYPSKGVAFTDIVLRDDDGVTFTPKWKLFDNATAVPQCGFKATSPRASEVDLAYTP